MNRLTLEERRRLFMARERASQATLEQLRQPAPAERLARATLSRRHRRFVVKVVTIAILLGGGLAAVSAVAFHLPGYVGEALLPRV